jgi:hypothetical protein
MPKIVEMLFCSPVGLGDIGPGVFFFVGENSHRLPIFFGMQILTGTMGYVKSSLHKTQQAIIYLMMSKA